MSILNPQKILVPTDFSEKSIEALDHALGGVAPGGEVTAIHILPELSPMEPGVLWQTIDDEKRIAEVEKAFRDRVSDAKYDNVKIHVAVGDPGLLITNYAEQESYDLIILPSHGRTGISRLLIGSVAERVARLAHCPVLVLKGKPKE